EDGIRDRSVSRGLGDVYKRQGLPLSVQRRFPELENRHVDFLKRDIIKAMNKAAALDELIPGLLSEYIEQSG
ncbi:terminase small subunit, partial [Staphylococcus aureus]